MNIPVFQNQEFIVEALKALKVEPTKEIVFDVYVYLEADVIRRGRDPLLSVEEGKAVLLFTTWEGRPGKLWLGQVQPLKAA
jgi:hypothetical protein